MAFDVKLMIKTRPNVVFDVDVTKDGKNYVAGTLTNYGMSQEEATVIKNALDESLNALNIPMEQKIHGDGVTYQYKDISETEQLLVESAVNNLDARVIGMHLANAVKGS